ncbi:MAG TPA: diaminopimelate dehydrogenase [Synergistaceae bacterium]|nr:diaminopimelate dehydrogenase [Synergistaceae bacterium]HCP06879.1 diaminopimelate dehydrogenase [Synergistaceae bacterium]
MEKIRVAAVGYGHIAREAVKAVKSAQDMEMTGIVIRDPGRVDEISRESGLPVALDPCELEKFDVAILAIASRAVPEVASSYLERGICTVDCFDIHGDALMLLRERLHRSALKGNSAALTGAGWDPGTDSIFRGVFEVIAPRGITYTSFGPGVSMGHTVAAKQIPGVREALSLTLPAGQGKHRRAVYVELAEGASLEDVRKAIICDSYFCHDETTVEEVGDVKSMVDLGHGVRMERKGASACADNQRMTLEMCLTNPNATAQVMVSSARGIVRQLPGCYTMLEIPVADFLPGDREANIRRLV